MEQYKQPFTLYKRGKVWYYRLGADPKRVPHSTGKSNKKEAELIAAEMAKRGVLTPVAKKKLKEYLPEALATYLKTLAADGNAVTDLHSQDTKRYLRYVLNDRIAELKLGDVKVSHVADFKLRLLEEMKDKKNTASRVLRLLKMLLRTAYERQEIPSDPSGGTKGVRRITVKSKTRQIYTPDQLEVLFPVEPWERGHYHPWSDQYDYGAFLLAVSTGMRRQEILGLKWSAVFLEEEVPYVVVIEELAKSKKRRATPIFDRVVFGDDRCVKAMRHLRDSISRKKAMVMTMTGAPVENFCFGYVDGTPRRETWWTKHFRQALDRAGIPRGGDEFTMPLDAHAFRHSLASQLKSRGMPDGLVRSFCGWASLNIQTTYTHFDASLVANYSQWISQHG